MTTKILILTLFSFVGWSSAAFYWGSCPDVTVKDDFVVDSYLGTWYEIARYSPIPFEDDESQCTQAVYSYSSQEEGAIDVVNSAILPDGTLDEAEGIARIPDPSEPAKLVVKFSQFAPGGKYWVLDTDYDRYSMVHSCTNYFFGLFRTEINWILSHYRQLDEATLNQIFAKFTAQGVDLDPFIASNQDGCELRNDVIGN